MSHLILLALLALQSPATLPATAPATRPATLPVIEGAAVLQMNTSAKHVLVIPDDLDVAAGTFDVLVQLKGSPQRVNAALRDNKLSAVAIVVTEGGLSKAYSDPFSDPELLQRMLDEATAAVRKKLGREDLKPGKLCLGSFSAGFGAVRELLKHDRWFERIDGIYMQDSIYAGYVSDTDKRVNPANMVGFRRFAVAAAEGRKVMVITHTRLTPGSYASTYETADDLLEAVGTKADAVEPNRNVAKDFNVYREARKGNFHLVGTFGDDGQEHGRHLMNMGLWIGELPLRRKE
jgi:hypothetical protein